jgi:pyruvate dehydrogenase E2 component (dihydrolipoamide acetyltransferase)
MAKILDMPKLSPTMEEGVLQVWHKKEGDPVEVDDLLAEVETDKATMEFRAFDKGTLLKQLVPEGTTVSLGQPVAILGKQGEDIASLLAKAGTASKSASASASASTPARAPSPAQAQEGKPTGTEDVDEATRPEPAPHTARTGGNGAPPSAGPVTRGSLLTRTEREPEEEAPQPGGRVLASPYVRKVARERGIDLSRASGTGDHGRITPGDLESLGGRGDGGARAAQPETKLARVAPSPLAAPGLTAPEAKPLSPMRKAIARRLTQSKQTVPHFYLTIDVDADALVRLREGINTELASSKGGDGADKPLKVSLNDLLIKACATALVHVPECNAQYTDEALLFHNRVDISVAVAVPDGLVTPVVRNADQKSIVAIAREVRDLASRARAKKLKPEEMSDGTFSISNLGMFGIDEFAAVINPPEGAILAVGQVRDEPVVRSGAVVPGKKLAMTLSCDHRVVDGAVGAAFLAELRALIEHPMRILTG